MEFFGKAIKAKEETQIRGYQEKIELIRNELRLENENYEPPSLAQMKDEFDKNQTNWVAETEIKQVDGIETLELKTKEGYIFHITMTGTKYKGKGEIVDTSALERKDALKLEIVGDGSNGGKLVQITDLSGVDYYTIEYQIGSKEGNWQTIKSGEKVEVGVGLTIYARLSYETNKGVIVKLSIDASAPTVETKNTDTSQLVRKTQMPLADLFEITWASDGTGEIEYQVTGNLNFKNTDFNSTQINDLAELEIGNYTVTCKVTSPSNKTATATKQNVKVTKLASTSVTNASNNNVTANAIYSEYDFAYFRDLVNGGQNTINGKWMNDINLANVCSASIGNWEAIRTYQGILDGDNKRIDHVYIQSSSTEQGIFGYIENATIKNVALGTGNITGANKVGGLVGYAKNSTIDNITNHSTEVSATVTYSEGGINYVSDYGRNVAVYEIADAYSLGGIIGKAEDTNVKNATNHVNITGQETASVVGGIVGYAKSESEYQIYHCVNHGQITNSSRMGGIVGDMSGKMWLENCTNNGNISAPSSTWFVGGIGRKYYMQKSNADVIIQKKFQEGRM